MSRFEAVGFALMLMIIGLILINLSDAPGPLKFAWLALLTIGHIMVGLSPRKRDCDE